MTKLHDMERPKPNHIEGSVGVIYVAIRARFVLEAKLSAESVRRFLPGVPIVLFTDQKLEDKDGFDEIIWLSEPHPQYHINNYLTSMHCVALAD